MLTKEDKSKIREKVWKYITTRKPRVQSWTEQINDYIDKTIEMTLKTK